MKRIVLATLAASLTMCAFGQDSTKHEKADTIKIGGMIIIKKEDKNDTAKNRRITISNKKDKNPNIKTNWFIVDLGFANYSDNTDYMAAQSQGFVSGDINEESLKLRTGKSVNVNIWVFMQKLNLAKHILNLKYGLGVELNNYRFDNEQVQFLQDPTKIVLNEEWKGIKKNKLAADYVTLPLMLNVNFTPGKKAGFGLSGGVSAGYLYSSRQKIKVGSDKDKTHDDFNLRKWKLAYIGELSLGPVRLYGSYSLKSIFDKGLDQTPYNVGLRLSRL